MNKVAAAEAVAVRARGLSIRFAEGSVLSGFDLDVFEGETAVLLGPSGCGKSTLLDCLAGLRTPDGGLVEVAYPQNQIGYLMQRDSLLPWRTLVGNVVVGAEIMRGVVDRDVAMGLLASMGLSDSHSLFPSEASQGMRQRVALARTLFHAPRLLFLDEPFSNIDLPMKLAVQSWLRSDERCRGATFVIVTHDLEDAITLADRILVLGGPPLRIKTAIDAASLRGNVDPVELRSRRAFGELFGLLWSAVNDTTDA